MTQVPDYETSDQIWQKVAQNMEEECRLAMRAKLKLQAVVLFQSFALVVLTFLLVWSYRQ